MLWHLQADLKIEQAIRKTQFGFSRGSSTEAAVHKLTHQIERALSAGNFALGVFLDIEGAFDNVSFDALSTALARKGIGGCIGDWITSCISHRSLYLSLAGTSISRFVAAGCPQGGVLSPFLWNLVLDDLLSNFEIADSFLQAFADDLAMVLSTSALFELRRKCSWTCAIPGAHLWAYRLVLSSRRLWFSLGVVSGSSLSSLQWTTDEHSSGLLGEVSWGMVGSVPRMGTAYPIYVRESPQSSICL